MDAAQRIAAIAAMDLKGKITALLPLIETLLPRWVEGWADDASRKPVTSGVRLLQQLAHGKELRVERAERTAAGCLATLAEIGEDAQQGDPAEIAPPAMAVGLTALLLAEAIAEADGDVELPDGASLEGTIREGIPHLLGVIDDKAFVLRALGVPA